jgi:hypothetical protein
LLIITTKKFHMKGGRWEAHPINNASWGTITPLLLILKTSG